MADAEVDQHVPLSLRVAAAWSWRVLVVGLAVSALVALILRLQLVAVALFVGLFITALLSPMHARLVRWRWPRWLATVTVLVTLVIVLLGAAALVGGSIVNEWGALSASFQQGLDDIRRWLADGPFHVSDGQIDRWLANLQQAMSENQSSLVSGFVTTAATAAEVVSGAFLAFFASIFFLHDGHGISRWGLRLFPARAQEGAEEAGSAAWATLTGYVRGTVIIALVDGLAIGIVLTILKVPLAGPLAVLVFFGAFIPIVGALVTGFVAVVVALAAKGLITAVVVLAAIIGIQQLEGHVLQPVVMGRLVRLHPLAVVVAVTAGSLLGGIIGAVVAVPLVAVVNVVIRTYRGRSLTAEHVGATAQDATAQDATAQDATAQDASADEAADDQVSADEVASEPGQ